MGHRRLRRSRRERIPATDRRRLYRRRTGSEILKCEIITFTLHLCDTSRAERDTCGRIHLLDTGRRAPRWADGYRRRSEYLDHRAVAGLSDRANAITVRKGCGIGAGSSVGVRDRGDGIAIGAGGSEGKRARGAVAEGNRATDTTTLRRGGGKLHRERGRARLRASRESRGGWQSRGTGAT